MTEGKGESNGKEVSHGVQSLMCPGVMKPGKKLRWLNVSKSMLSRVSPKNYLSPIRQK